MGAYGITDLENTAWLESIRQWAESIPDDGVHCVYSNTAGSVHYTRYRDGRTSPMVDPLQAVYVETDDHRQYWANLHR